MSTARHNHGQRVRQAVGSDAAPSGNHRGTHRDVDQNHIEATPLGSRRLVALRPSEVQAWATERSRRLSPSTLRHVVSTLRSVFNAAARDRLVAHNPVLGVSLPRSERERIVPLTVDQVRGLTETMPPRCQAMVITQAGLGLRIGELMALHRRTSISCGVRCGLSGRPSPPGSTACHPRRQDHGGRWRCPRWLRMRSRRTSRSSRQSTTAHCSLGSMASRGATSTTARGSLHQRCAGLGCRRARRATI